MGPRAHEVREIARVHSGVEELLPMTLRRDRQHWHATADSLPDGLVARRDDDASAFSKEVLEELLLLLMRIKLALSRLEGLRREAVYLDARHRVLFEDIIECLGVRLYEEVAEDERFGARDQRSRHVYDRRKGTGRGLGAYGHGLSGGFEDRAHDVHHRLAAHLHEGLGLLESQRIQPELRRHVRDRDLLRQGVELEEARERQVVHVEDLAGTRPDKIVNDGLGLLDEMARRL
mmetsp:Transcript_31334/g.62673  ORF Transcript_31334/g.62673 Transcript_31334/m.62673 type:complete len:233 (+) Transcript_31334:342-1040(+)